MSAFNTPSFRLITAISSNGQHTWAGNLAPVQPQMNTENFDHVSLSGNESDASYDTADDILLINTQKPQFSAAKPIPEASKVNGKGKGNSFKDESSRKPLGSAEKAAWTKQAHMTSGDSDVESVTSVGSGLDGAEIDRDNEVQAVEEEEDNFYDMSKDQKVSEYRRRFLLEVNAVLRVLDSTFGVEAAGLRDVPKHTRAIAAMFGDNVLQLRQIIESFKIHASQISSKLSQQQNAIESYKAQFNTEAQARQHLEGLHQQAVQTAIKAKAYHQNEKNGYICAISRIQAAKTGLEQELERSKSQVLALLSKIREADIERNGFIQAITQRQACKAGLKREAERYESQIAAYKTSLQKAEIEQQRERFAKEELQTRLDKQVLERIALQHNVEIEAAAHRKAMKAEQKENKVLVADIERLDNVRQSICEELNSTKISYQDAIEAVKAEREAKETAIADKKRLESEIIRSLYTIEEVKAECSMMAEKERKGRDQTRLENQNLKKEIEPLKSEQDGARLKYAAWLKQESLAKEAALCENKKLHNDLVRTKNSEVTVRGELKECHKALKDAMKDQSTEEQNHKNAVQELEEKIVNFNMQVGVLHKSIKSMVITDGKRVQTIEKLNAQLTEANDSLEKIKSCLRSPNNRYPEHQLIAKLMDQRQANRATIETLTSQLEQWQEYCRKLKPFGEELLRTLKTCSGLVGEKHALATRVVLLEDEVASAEKFRKNVHNTITSLFKEVDSNPESQRIIELMERIRELETREEEATSDEALKVVEDFIEAQILKLEDLDLQYRKGLSSLLPHSQENDAESSSTSTTPPPPLPPPTKNPNKPPPKPSQQLLNQENAIKNLNTMLETQNLTQQETASTLQRLQQSNIQLSTSHAAALNELRERRDQIAEFEVLQQELEMKEAKAVAQKNRFQNEVRCLQDLHDRDVEKIEKVETQIRTLRRNSVQMTLVEQVEDVGNGDAQVDGNEA